MSHRKGDSKLDLLGWLPDTALQVFLKLGALLFALDLLALLYCLAVGVDATIALLATLIALGIMLVARWLLHRRCTPPQK